jgi:hypothetical protein
MFPKYYSQPLDAFQVLLEPMSLTSQVYFAIVFRILEANVEFG